jgi:hypothetical protein
MARISYLLDTDILVDWLEDRPFIRVRPVAHLVELRGLGLDPIPDHLLVKNASLPGRGCRWRRAARTPYKKVSRQCAQVVGVAEGVGVDVGCSGAHTNGMKFNGEMGEIGRSRPELSRGLACNCHESRPVRANARSTTMTKRWLKLDFIGKASM